jgi:endoglucanase
MKRTFMGGAAALAIGLSVGCNGAGPEPKAAESKAGGSTLAMAVSTVETNKCAPEFTIDDAEDNNNQILSQKGRGGYWYTYADKLGTRVVPAAGGKFSMTKGGAASSGHGARMVGKVSSDGEVVFAGMGLGFTDPKRPYDASAFTGISFWARVEGDSARQVRLKVPDVSTDPAGGVCSACFNDFGVDLTLTTTWTKYTIPFSAMTQQDGWGAPHPPAIDPSKLYGLQWQVVTPGAAFDVWVDEIQFTGC